MTIYLDKIINYVINNLSIINTCIIKNLSRIYQVSYNAINNKINIYIQLILYQFIDYSVYRLYLILKTESKFNA